MERRIVKLLCVMLLQNHDVKPTAKQGKKIASTTTRTTHSLQELLLAVVREAVQEADAAEALLAAVAAPATHIVLQQPQLGAADRDPRDPGAGENTALSAWEWPVRTMMRIGLLAAMECNHR
jgi:hypothetical protein